MRLLLECSVLVGSRLHRRRQMRGQVTLENACGQSRPKIDRLAAKDGKASEDSQESKHGTRGKLFVEERPATEC